MMSFLLTHITQQNTDAHVSNCRFNLPPPDLTMLQTYDVHYVVVIFQKLF
jgi:hypothetical protein